MEVSIQPYRKSPRTPAWEGLAWGSVEPLPTLPQWGYAVAVIEHLSIFGVQPLPQKNQEVWGEPRMTETGTH